MISVGDVPVASSGEMRSQQVLRVASIRIAKPCDDMTLVYKVGESRFESDYYHGFIAPPDRMLTGELVRWLRGSGIYANVVAGDSAADTKLLLEGNVTKLYGDFTSQPSPTAVVQVTFFLIDQSTPTYSVVFTKQ